MSEQRYSSACPRSSRASRVSGWYSHCWERGRKWSKAWTQIALSQESVSSSGTASDGSTLSERTGDDCATSSRFAAVAPGACDGSYEAVVALTVTSALSCSCTWSVFAAAALIASSVPKSCFRASSPTTLVAATNECSASPRQQRDWVHPREPRTPRRACPNW